MNWSFLLSCHVLNVNKKRYKYGLPCQLEMINFNKCLVYLSKYIIIMFPYNARSDWPKQQHISYLKIIMLLKTFLNLSVVILGTETGVSLRLYLVFYSLGKTGRTDIRGLSILLFRVSCPPSLPSRAREYCIYNFVGK